MIATQQADILEVSQDRVVSRVLSVSLLEDALLSQMLYDAGDGYRPFSPLIIRLDGVETALPYELAAGDHTIELLGEGFDGTKLMLIGQDLQGVTSVTIGGAEANQLAAALAELALKPGYYEVATKPPVTGYKNGDKIYVISEGVYYTLSEGRWRQQG